VSLTDEQRAAVESLARVLAPSTGADGARVDTAAG